MQAVASFIVCFMRAGERPVTARQERWRLQNGSETDKRPIAVIGAGFTGTMTALHLLARVPDRRVLLCERAGRFARGAAYSTPDPVHLLNVRAANMSAFPDRPTHFAEWVAAQGPSESVHETPVGTFVTRDLFGRYLASLVSDALGCQDGAERLRIVPEAVTDLAPEEGGYTLALDGGRKHRVSAAVLAVGNLLPDRRAESAYVENPWAAPFADKLNASQPVLVLGTGLTMVDVVSRLWASGFPGPVIALSRRGLLSHTHHATTPRPTPDFSAEERRSLSALVRRVRQEVRAASEQGVDSAKLRGDYHWHVHDTTDDFFLVLHGRLHIDLEDGATVTLEPGQMYVVPQGVRHRPRAPEEAHILLIEPTGTPNSGDPRTAAPRRVI